MNFSEISSVYHDTSTVQSSAGEILINILRIRGDEDILDVGCGTGKLTQRLRGMTRGNVVGTDISLAMIDEARKRYSENDISFLCLGGEELSRSSGTFDIVFCNSTFQWFRNPAEVVRNFYSVLRPLGRVGIQAPATELYCPNFIEAVQEVENSPKTRTHYSHFQSPWYFKNTSAEYEKLFHDVGFTVLFSEIDATPSAVGPDKAFEIFSSGAIAGYLNPEYYSEPFDAAYAENFKDIVRNSLRHQAGPDGTVSLVFSRIFLVATRD